MMIQPFVNAKEMTNSTASFFRILVADNTAIKTAPLEGYITFNSGLSCYYLQTLSQACEK